MATFGLSEVLIDGTLCLKGFALQIENVVGAVVYYPHHKKSKSESEERPEPEPRPLDRQAVHHAISGKELPAWWLPPAAAREKRKLLLCGEGRFDVRLPYVPTEGKPTIETVCEWLGGAISNPQPSRHGGNRNVPFVEVSVTLRLGENGSPAVLDSSGQQLSATRSEKRWGTYRWADMRNLTAHWRVPLGRAFDKTLTLALEDWLPRYIGLYAWAIEVGASDGASSNQTCLDEMCLEKGRVCLGAGECRPWHDKSGRLRDWLQVP